MPGRHALHRLARAEEGADDIDAHHALDPLDAHLVDTRLDVDDAGIVDESVEAAEGPVHRLEHRHDIGFAADIALDREGLTAGGFELGDERISRSLIGDIVDRHAIAGRTCLSADGGTNAAAAAGDQQRLLVRAHSWQPFRIKMSHGTLEKPAGP